MTARTIQYAMVNTNGEIQNIIVPGDIGMYGDRSTQGGLLVVHIEGKVDANDFINTKYWDFDTSKWLTREEIPGDYYLWRDKEWKLDTDRLQKALRDIRNIKLAGCDWTMMPDVNLTDVQQELWRLYRQKLRDITDSYKDLTHLKEVQWPTAPGE